MDYFTGADLTGDFCYTTLTLHTGCCVLCTRCTTTPLVGNFFFPRDFALLLLTLIFFAVNYIFFGGNVLPFPEIFPR